jgi:hypothetical protein
VHIDRNAGAESAANALLAIAQHKMQLTSWQEVLATHLPHITDWYCCAGMHLASSSLHNEQRMPQSLCCTILE